MRPGWRSGGKRHGQARASVGRAGAEHSGALLQVAAWVLACVAGHSIVALAVVVIVLDVGLQCQQLSNQSDCLRLLPRLATEPTQYL